MSKIINAIKKGAEYIAEDRNGYARVGKLEEITEEGYQESYYVSYGQDMMPAHLIEDISESEIEATMRGFEKDLRKWRWNGG